MMKHRGLKQKLHIPRDDCSQQLIPSIRHNLMHFAIVVAFISQYQTWSKHLVMYFKHNCKHLDKCLRTSTSISAFIMLKVLFQALQKCLKYKQYT